MDSTPELSASGLPYTGDPETDAILDDPELTGRLLQGREVHLAVP